VATAPAIVETLYFLGLGDRVVGVGDFAVWPPEVAEKPRIGGLFDPQLETIAALEPDLAILLVSEKGLEEPLARLGVEVMLLEVESIEDTEEAIAAIAERMGVADRAEELLARWQTELEPNPIAPSADGQRPRVLLSIVRDPGRLSAVLTANRDTFYEELLERMGAENLFADAPVRYPQVSAEEILARRPSVLIELQPRAPEAGVAEQLAGDWRGVPFAGGTPCTRIVAGEHTVLPGPRLPLLYRDLRAAVAECAAYRNPG
jgi:cobalamin transport system substrate-binding protein